MRTHIPWLFLLFFIAALICFVLLVQSIPNPTEEHHFPKRSKQKRRRDRLRIVCLVLLLVFGALAFKFFPFS